MRASFDDTTVTVYQAYSPEIAEPAVAAGSFVPPFSLNRMTWIKPSFFWMMYRCGWATKPGQERVLAITITREGFEQALGEACLSHYDPQLYATPDDWARRKEASPVRVQWDPERSRTLQPLPWRSLQLGLSGTAASQVRLRVDHGARRHHRPRPRPCGADRDRRTGTCGPRGSAVPTACSPRADHRSGLDGCAIEIGRARCRRPEPRSRDSPSDSSDVVSRV